MDDPQFLVINTHRQRQSYRNPTGDWLGIHYIAAFLNENGINTMAFAGYAHEVPRLLEEILSKKSMRTIGFSCDYENQAEVISFCKRIKSESNIPIIVGGPQATFLDEDFFQKTCIDAIVCGEGELTTLELVQHILEDDYDFHAIKGLKYMKNHVLITTPPRPLIQNLDALPFPNAKFALGSLFRPTLASFLTGRGCPYSCSFCYEGGNTKGVRWRSVENVIQEIAGVLENRPDLHYIMFTDDTFTIDSERVKQFCVQLKNLREKYSFTWFCEGHVRTLYGKSDLLRLMVDAGLSCLQIGIESGHDDILQAFNKKITTAMIESVVKDAFDVGVEQLWGNIILGGAFETQDRIKHNMDFCHHLYEIAPGMINIDIVYFWPLPGTRITTSPNQYGMKILDIESNTSAMDFPVVEYPDVTIEDFCNLRCQFIKMLEKAAYDLVPQIPMERIKKLLKSNDGSKNLSVWLRVVYQTEEYMNFFSLMNCGATILSSDVSEGYLRTSHPMRTGHPEKFTSDGRLIVHDVILSPEETKILCLASGKRNWKDLRIASGFSEKKYKKILFELESKRLLTFSKY